MTVNAVAPGQIATDMGSNLTSDQLRDLTAHIPVGRLGRPDEIAWAVRFLASAEASYITGATLDINGGSPAAEPALHDVFSAATRLRLADGTATPRSTRPA